MMHRNLVRCSYETTRVIGSGTELTIAFDYRVSPPVPAKLYGPWENCHPEEPAEIWDYEVRIENTLLEGSWADAMFEVFEDELLDHAMEVLSEW